MLKTRQMFSVHTTQEKFENGDFMLKTRQMFPVHTTQEEFENGGFEPLQRRSTSAKVPWIKKCLKTYSVASVVEGADLM